MSDKETAPWIKKAAAIISDEDAPKDAAWAAKIIEQEHNENCAVECRAPQATPTLKASSE